MVDAAHFLEGMRRDAISLAHVAEGAIKLPSTLAQPPRRVRVLRPKPHAARLSARIQGWVECWENGARLGRVSYGHKRDERLVRTTQFETEEMYQRQGVATLLARELMRSYPGCRLAFSGMEPTAAGDALYQSLRRGGVAIHAGTCPLTGPICPCGLQMVDSSPS